MDNSKSVLGGDDNDHIRKCIAGLLRKQGYSVHSVADGNEALYEIRQKGRVDLMILDVLMPKLDGYQVLYQLRLHGYQDIPVILLTGKSDFHDIVRGYNRGADLYITKPYTAHVLLNAVEYLMGGLSREKEEALEQELLAASEVFLCAPSCMELGRRFRE